MKYMECYVCTDIAYTLSPCDCKNLYVIIEKPRRETIHIWYPIICRSNLRPYNSCDFYFEPFRHFVLTLFLMNVVKYCFSPSKYIPAVYMPGDYIYWSFALVMYLLIVIVCRGTHEGLSSSVILRHYKSILVLGRLCELALFHQKWL